MAKKGELSPMMQQYFKVKKEYPGVILFFRLGDFYEMFFDDAKVASKELDLVLTGRDCGQEERAPMCGFTAQTAILQNLCREATRLQSASKWRTLRQLRA